MTYAIKPVPIDDNGHALLNHASDLITFRLPPGLLTTPWAAQMLIDAKGFFLHIEGSGPHLAMAGAYPGGKVPLFGAVVDNQDGTVTLPLPSGIVVAPQTSLIVQGTTHYDGTYTVAGNTQDGDPIIPAVYVAEVFNGVPSAAGCVYAHLTPDGWTTPVFRLAKPLGEILFHIQPNQTAISMFGFR